MFVVIFVLLRVFVPPCAILLRLRLALSLSPTNIDEELARPFRTITPKPNWDEVVFLHFVIGYSLLDIEYSSSKSEGTCAYPGWTLNQLSAIIYCRIFQVGSSCPHFFQRALFGLLHGLSSSSVTDLSNCPLGEIVRKWWRKWCNRVVSGKKPPSSLPTLAKIPRFSRFSVLRLLPYCIMVHKMPCLRWRIRPRIGDCSTLRRFCIVPGDYLRNLLESHWCGKAPDRATMLFLTSCNWGRNGNGSSLILP